MDRQLFQVGELVIICCSLYKEANGVIASILEIERTDWVFPDGEIEKNAIGYRLDVRTAYSDWFDHSVLRKHHPPSTKSFTEIMEELKGPVKA